MSVSRLRKHLYYLMEETFLKDDNSLWITW
jgi:hypothetical protein